MLTAKTSDNEIVQGLKLGADDYLAKPFSIRQLVPHIEAVLRHFQIGIVSKIMELGEEPRHYYGYYSNRSRGARRLDLALTNPGPRLTRSFGPGNSWGFFLGVALWIMGVHQGESE